MSDCKRYLEEPACLLRQSAEGSVQPTVNQCQLCDISLDELILQPELIKQVAGEISTSFAAESGHRRAADLARAGFAFGNSPEDTALLIRCPSCGSQSAIDENSTLNNFACSTCDASIQIVDQPAEVSSEKRRLGHFELLDQVGSGSFGVVWKAHDTELDRTVAIKIPRREQLSAKDVEDFVHEARASAALHHPHIVSVYEIGRADESVYIVSDFVEGSTLDDYLSDRLLSGKEAATICATIADALDHAHKKGVVHRDLKPANIALDDQLKPTIMDFGLALRGGTEMTMTTDGKILGTPAYMSPEQARGESNQADGRSDIYSLGVIMYQMLTGERPFRGNLRMLLDQITHDEPLNPQRLNSAVPRDLATICLKCLEKSPERRYQSSRELKSDLDRFLEGRPIAARPVSYVERGWRWCARNPVPAGLATLFLVSLVTGTAVSTWKWRDATVAMARSEKILRIVRDSFDAVNPESGATVEMSAKDVLLKAKDSLGKSDLDDLGKIRLLSELSASFGGLGEPDLKIQTAEQWRSLSTAKLGSDHSDTLSSMHVLATGYRAVGRTEEAIRLHEQTLELRQAKLGLDHPDTLSSMDRLASTYREAGRTKEAIRLGEQTLQLQKAKLGADHPDTLNSMSTLGSSYRVAGRTEEAIVLHEQTLQLRRAKLGPDHPETFTSMHVLASSYHIAGRTEEAMQLREQTLQLRQAKLGPDHPSTLSSMNSLANSYRTAGRLEEAITLYEQTLKLRKSKLGPDHPDTLNSLNNLAIGYRAAGRLEEAMRLHEQTFQLRQAKLGPEHPATLSSLSSVALGHYHAGRIEEAIRLHEQVLKLRQAKLGPDHPDTLHSLFSLATSYGQSGRTEDAIRLGEEALKLKQAKLGPDHPSTLSSMNNLAIEYHDAGRTEEAVKLDEQTLKLRQTKLGPDHPRTLSSMTNLADGYDATGRIEEAVGLYEEALKLKQATLGPDDPETLSTMNSLVWCLSKIKLADRRLSSDLLGSIRTACEATQDGEMFQTLAAAEYRLGNFDQAIAAAENSIKLSEPASPISYAVLAMSHYRLEHSEQANKFRAKLAEAMELDEFRADADSQIFADEVAALFDSD